MFARETYQDSMEENYSNNHNIDEDDEAEEEALSFCDLPIYGRDDADWEKFSKEDQRLSSSSSSSATSEQDLFEFFSEHWSSGSDSSSYPVHENILFCGKLIPTKEPVSITTAIGKLERNKEEQEKPRKRGLSRWKSKWFFSRQRSLKSLSLPVSEKYGHKAEKGGGKYGFSVRRVSILAAVPAKKPRWNSMMFGLARLPAEMELSDIRSRQSRRNPEAKFRRGGGSEVVSGGGKGWWGMIRALGCGGSIHATAVSVM